MNKSEVLIACCDDKREVIADFLIRRQLCVTRTGSKEEALNYIRRHEYKVVISDMSLTEDLCSGLTIYNEAKKKDHLTGVIMIAGFMDVYHQTKLAEIDSFICVQETNNYMLDFIFSKIESLIIKNKKAEVFMCYNHKDQEMVTDIEQELKKNNVKVWIDHNSIPPGRRIKEYLCSAFDECKTVAIFQGKHGYGEFQEKEEIDIFVDRARIEDISLIPVFLKTCPQGKEISHKFIEKFKSVDFRKTKPDAMEQLIWGIKEGVKIFDKRVADQEK